MADPSSYKPAPGSVPTTPGVYRFRDAEGRVIYVGKAKNLRARLANYFQDLSTLHPRTQRMVTTGASVEWTVVGSEVEALALEFTWIKEFDPRFNVIFKDDKTYPRLVVTTGDKVPRIMVTRRDPGPHDKVFGPYPSAWAIRETVDLLLRVFPVRTCTQGVYKRAERTQRACLLGYIEKCSAPCIGRVSETEHQKIAQDFAAFMAGDTGTFVTSLEGKMKGAASEMDYEAAARYRDDLVAVRKVLEKNAVVLPDATDADVLSLVEDELHVSVQVFHVRGGRIRGQRGWISEKVDDSAPGDVVERALMTLYDGAPAPREVLVPTLPGDTEQLRDWLASTSGRRPEIRVPRRGHKAELAERVRLNAEQALNLHKLKRSSDMVSRSKALEEIAQALDLDTAPLRIECFDISHTGGENVVASMVVFEDGLPRKSEYRRFSITGEAARDDTASMFDVITRRLRRLAAAGSPTLASGEIDPDTDPADSSNKFRYRPGLIIVDGGQPQVAAAARAFDDAGVTDIALAGLAKRLEEIWLPHDEFPVILPRTSEGLFLLQRVRDEAHRFAISFHRSKRGRAMSASQLDGIPGLGPKRREALLAAFDSVAGIRAATLAQIAAVPGIGNALAETIMGELHSDVPSGGINMTTGEILSPAPRD
ncbi:excinuclease ABC subunit UvrC [Micrococcales bacterium 31B]|nr:excinuclease ABC subunit UvrC [Micrococcales bacterium 31B]